MTATQDRPAAEIGKDRRRKEDQRLITGRTRWTDNITLPGMLHLAMVRSPFAHATIASVDVEAAKASPNVVAVLSGKDFGDELGVCINAWPITPNGKVDRDALPAPAARRGGAAGPFVPAHHTTRRPSCTHTRPAPSGAARASFASQPGRAPSPCSAAEVAAMAPASRSSRRLRATPRQILSPSSRARSRVTLCRDLITAAH